MFVQSFFFFCIWWLIVIDKFNRLAVQSFELNGFFFYSIDVCNCFFKVVFLSFVDENDFCIFQLDVMFSIVNGFFRKSIKSFSLLFLLTDFVYEFDLRFIASSFCSFVFVFVFCFVFFRRVIIDFVIVNATATAIATTTTTTTTTTTATHV